MSGPKVSCRDFSGNPRSWRAQSDEAQASPHYLFTYYLGSSVVGSVSGVFWNLDEWPEAIFMTWSLLVVAIAIALWLSRRDA